MLIPFGVFSAGVSGGDSGGGSFDLISTTLLTGSQASVTFDVTGLSSTYKHLQIRMTARTSNAAAYGEYSIRMNSDSGTNYVQHTLGGNGSTVFSNSAGTSRTSIENYYSLAGNTATSGIYGAVVHDILDPFSSTKNKTIRQLGGKVVSGENFIGLQSGAWLSTSAVTSITLAGLYSTSFVSGSRFSLYGIKG